MSIRESGEGRDEDASAAAGPVVEGVPRGALAILDAIGQAVIATDLEGEVIYWSPAAEALYGWTREEAIGTPVVSLTPSERGLERAGGIMETIRREGSWSGEFELTRKDGSTFIGVVTNAVIRDDSGDPVGMVGVSSDLTELREVEFDLGERVKELQTLIEATEILADSTLDRDTRLQAFVDRIPAGWVDPDTTATCLTFDGRTYRSEGYRAAEHSIGEPVDVEGLEPGHLEVVRTAVPVGQPPFLPQERDLLESLAHNVEDAISRERTARRLHRTVEALDVAVFLVDSNIRTILAANPAAERIFRYTSEEFVGSTTEKLHTDRESFLAFGEESEAVLERGEVFRASFDMRRADGEVFPAEQTVTLLDPEHGLEAGAVSVVRDRTEAERAREEALRSQERFRVIAEHLEDILWIGSPERGVIEYVSPSYREVWGRDPDRLLEDPTTWLEAMHPEDVDRVSRHGTLTGTTGPRERDIQYRIVRPDGDIRWIHDRTFLVRNASGAVTRVIGIAADVSERRRAEERLAAITREISDALYVLEPNGDVRFATASVSRNTGFTAEEFEELNALSIVHPEDRERVGQLLRWVAAEPGRSTRAEYRFLDTTSEERHVESIARNLIDDPGVKGILVATRDVTERVQLERALEQSQRLEAIGRLAGGIAHDFNNVLTVIRSQASLLKFDVEDPATIEEVEIIEEAVDRAATLTSQLLAFSREQVLQPRPVDICSVVGRVARMVERVIGPSVSLETDLPGDLPTVMLDPAQLEQVLLNLAINARDAMPEGGTLALRTRQRRIEEGTDEYSAIPPGVYSELLVSDTGVGMSPEVASRAFEPFFTTKTEQGGTGLGLATAYGFVRQSGGDIALESRPGEGTTFRIVFPTVDRDALPVSSASTTRPESDTASGRLLLVEDEESVRRVVTRMLERAGYEVESVGSAEEAVDLLDSGWPAEGVLTDLGLPGKSGRDLVDWCREQRPHLPVAVMSGYAAESPGGRKGIPPDISFLGKPFTPAQLLETARDLLTPSDDGA